MSDSRDENSGSELFYDAASIDYPIVDADAHVNEPPNLWLDRVPAKWRDRAPRVEHTAGMNRDSVVLKIGFDHLF